jgi:hypothetical protein
VYIVVEAVVVSVTRATGVAGTHDPTLPVGDVCTLKLRLVPLGTVPSHSKKPHLIP